MILLRLLGWLFFLQKTHIHRQRRFLRISDFIIRLRLGIIFLFVAVSIGTVGYIFIENIRPLNALYMTIITLTTVGFMEVQPLSDSGRIFTIFLIVFNLGLFGYAVSTLTEFITGGNFRVLFHDFRMLDKIDVLRSHTIICGYGRHAKEVCKELSKQNLPFVIIEKNEERIGELRDERAFVYIEGDATQDEILQEAGIERAHAIIVTLADDSDNLFVVLTARQLNADLQIISRAVDKRAEAKLLRAGANHVVMPERIGGFYMATLAHKPDLVEFFTLLSNITPGSVAFEEVNCADIKPEYIGKTIQTAGFRASTGANIIGIKMANGEYELNPLPDTILTLGMYIIILGKRDQINNFKMLALRS